MSYSRYSLNMPRTIRVAPIRAKTVCVKTKRVKCSNGKTYESISEAAGELHITQAAIGAAIRKDQAVKGFTFELLNTVNTLKSLNEKHVP